MRERLVQATDRAGTGSHAHEGLGHFPHLLSADPSDKHLCQSFCNMRFIAAVAFERLSMELTRAVSGHIEILDPARGRDQVALVIAVAIPFTPGAALSPRGPDQRVQLLAHHCLQHDAYDTASQFAQMLLEVLLIRQPWGILPLTELSRLRSLWYTSSDDTQA